MKTITKPPTPPPVKDDHAHTDGRGIVVMITGNTEKQVSGKDVMETIVDKLSFMRVERIFAYGSGVENAARIASKTLNCDFNSLGFEYINLLGIRPHIIIQFGVVMGGDQYKKLVATTKRVIRV